MLGDHYVSDEIELECLIKEKQRFSINPEAFSSSRNFTKVLKLSFCDASNLSFSFLRGFVKLWAISFYSISNIHLANWTFFPHLVSLTDLEIIDSKGMDKWAHFPNSITKLKYFGIEGNELDDEAMNRILQWIVDSPSVDTLQNLNMERNNLTQIPHHLSSFNKLERILLGENPLNEIVRAGSFNFSYPIRELSLSSCGISGIEPEALEGSVYYVFCAASNLHLYINYKTYILYNCMMHVQEILATPLLF